MTHFIAEGTRLGILPTFQLGSGRGYCTDDEGLCHYLAITKAREAIEDVFVRLSDINA